MNNRVQFRRYDVGYQPTENLGTQPPDKGLNVLPILITDLSKAYQELEENALKIYKLSGLKLDDIVERLAMGYTFKPPKKQNTSLADLVKETTNADRIRAMSDEELAKFIGRVKEPCDYCLLADVEGDCIETLCDDAMLKWLQTPAEEV